METVKHLFFSFIFFSSLALMASSNKNEEFQKFVPPTSWEENTEILLSPTALQPPVKQDFIPEASLEKIKKVEKYFQMIDLKWQDGTYELTYQTTL